MSRWGEEQVPDLLLSASHEAMVALQREELRIAQDVRESHRKVFMNYREQLSRAFLSHFVIEQRPSGPIQVWNPVAFRQEEVFDTLEDVLDDTVNEAEAADDAEMTEELDAAFLDGYDRELWFLALGGLPAERYRSALPEWKSRYTLLLAAGVAGESWRYRLRRWSIETQQRGKQAVRASVVGGRSFEDTNQLLDAAIRRHTNAVAALSGNELVRSWRMGAEVALSAVMQDHAVAEIWVTRQDGLVCPVCASLHMTVTALRPIDDTHPGCRCRKVPIPAFMRSTMITFDEFRGR